MFNEKIVEFPKPPQKTTPRNHEALIRARTSKYLIEQAYRMTKSEELLGVLKTLDKVERMYLKNEIIDHKEQPSPITFFELLPQKPIAKI